MVLFSQTARPSLLAIDVFLRENWLILLPLAFGFVGVYLLLPRPKRTSPVIAAAIPAICGLVLAALWWTRYESIWVERVLFYSFAGLAILGAAMMLSSKNPVHAALAFALVVLSSCGLFLLLAAPFLMAATLIIYAGAIVVTFLFVIMLAQQAGLSSADVRSREPFLSTMAGFVLLGTLAFILQRGYSTKDMDRVLDKLTQLAKADTKDDINKILGVDAPTQDLKAPLTLAFVDEFRKSFPPPRPKPGKDGERVLLADAPEDLNLAWAKQDVAAVQKAAAVLLDLGQSARNMKGSLLAESGTPASLARKPLPAQNVAALGRTLFTDFLIPVEMAGVLLLVATIGAIVIASRRTEGLR